MPNLNYCRFNNTLLDLRDCFYHLADENLSEEEARHRENLVKLCREIVKEWDEEHPQEKTNLVDAQILQARGLRLAVVQMMYNAGNLTKDQAIELLSGPLTPGDESTTVDDSDQLIIKVEEETK